MYRIQEVRSHGWTWATQVGYQVLSTGAPLTTRRNNTVDFSVPVHLFSGSECPVAGFIDPSCSPRNESGDRRALAFDDVEIVNI